MKKSVLFLGNSYTYYNDMPEAIFAPMAKEYAVTSLTRGGWWLKWYADPENEEHPRLLEALEGKHYDAVILQDNSLATIRDPDGFFGGIAKLKALISPHADRILLYVTWGRKPGNPTLTELGMTFDSMTEHIAAAYEEAAQRFGMECAHVGRAFAAYMADHPEAELYAEDMHHPSPLGSRIAAETILKVLQR